MEETSRTAPREMVGIEYAYIAEELSKMIAGKHLQKFQKIAESAYRLRFERFDVVCEVGRRIHITKYIEETEEADNFVQKLRKDVVGKRLIDVKQVNNDRILMFLFDDFSIVFEMFKNGNIILLKNNIIQAALREEKWSTREIKRGSTYVPPPPPPKTLEETLCEKPIITSLIKLSFGKNYASEIIRRAGIDEKTPGASLDEEAIKKIKREMEFEREPLVFIIDGKAVDFGLTRFSCYGEGQAEKTETLSEAADRYYWENKKTEEPEETKRLLDRLKKQEEHLNELKKLEEEYKTAAEWIYSHYNYVDALIQDAKKIGVRDLEKLKERYEEIKEIKKDKKIIEIENEEVKNQ